MRNLMILSSSKLKRCESMNWLKKESRNSHKERMTEAKIPLELLRRILLEIVNHQIPSLLTAEIKTNHQVEAPIHLAKTITTLIRLLLEIQILLQQETMHLNKEVLINLYKVKKNLRIINSSLEVPLVKSLYNRIQ